MPICAPSRSCYGAHPATCTAAYCWVPARAQTASAISPRHTTDGGRQRSRRGGHLRPISAAQLEELEASILPAAGQSQGGVSGLLAGSDTAPLQQDWEVEIEELQKLVSLLPASVRAAVEEHPEMTQLLEVCHVCAWQCAPSSPAWDRAALTMKRVCTFPDVLHTPVSRWFWTWAAPR